MPDRPSLDEILLAITKSGYLMEQEVASTLETLGLHVQTNRAFEDPEEGKSREIDVAAVQLVHNDDTNLVSVYVELLCECKNSRNPFVFLLRPKTRADKYREFQEILLPQDYYHVPTPGKPNIMTAQPALDYLGIRALHYRSTQSLKAVQFAKIVRQKDTWVANHSGLYDAIFYPLVKALLARRAEIKAFKGPRRYVWLFFPTVITSGELYTMDTATQPLSLTPCDYVSYVRHIKTAKMDSYFAIDFVTEKGLRDHIEKRVMPFGAAVAELVQKNPERYKKQ